MNLFFLLPFCNTANPKSFLVLYTSFLASLIILIGYYSYDSMPFCFEFDIWRDFPIPLFFDRSWKSNHLPRDNFRTKKHDSREKNSHVDDLVTLCKFQPLSIITHFFRDGPLEK
jgi:hypothetical protein